MKTKVPKLTPRQKARILGDAPVLAANPCGYEHVLVKEPVDFCEGLYVKSNGKLFLLEQPALRPVSLQEAFQWYANNNHLELGGDPNAQVQFLKRIAALLPPS